MATCSKCKTNFGYMFNKAEHIPELTIEKNYVRWVCPKCGNINLYKYSYINEEDFPQSCGWRAIKYDTLYNFRNQRGKLLSKEWFSHIDDFSFNKLSETAIVRRMDDTKGVLNKKGNLLGNQWFDRASNVGYGFIRVESVGKYNFINSEGLFLSDDWFDNTKGHFMPMGCVYVIPVCLKGKWNYLTNKGKMLSNQWFDDCDAPMHHRWGRVVLNGKENFITEGRHGEDIRYFSKIWFDECGYHDIDYGYEPYGKIGWKCFDHYGNSHIEFTAEEYQEMENALESGK